MNSNQIDIVGYSVDNLEISLQLIMDFSAKNVNMTEADFEM